MMVPAQLGADIDLSQNLNTELSLLPHGHEITIFKLPLYSIYKLLQLHLSSAVPVVTMAYCHPKTYVFVESDSPREIN
jgi:hypothetical protein